MNIKEDTPICPLLMLTARQDYECEGEYCAWYIFTNPKTGEGACALAVLAQRAAKKLQQGA